MIANQIVQAAISKIKEQRIAETLITEKIPISRLSSTEVTPQETLRTEPPPRASEPRQQKLKIVNV